MSDLISRQAAVDALIERDPNCGIDSAEVIKGLPSAEPERMACVEVKLSKEEIQEAVDDAVKKMMAEMEEPEPHWIPVSERLPEKDEWNNAFLVTIQCEHVDGWEDYYVSGAEYSEYGWEYIPCPVGAIKVVAWMIVSISPYQPDLHCTEDYCEIEIEEESE